MFHFSYPSWRCSLSILSNARSSSCFTFHVCVSHTGFLHLKFLCKSIASLTDCSNVKDFPMLWNRNKTFCLWWRPSRMSVQHSIFLWNFFARHNFFSWLIKTSVYFSDYNFLNHLKLKAEGWGKMHEKINSRKLDPYETIYRKPCYDLVFLQLNKVGSVSLFRQTYEWL